MSSLKDSPQNRKDDRVIVLKPRKGGDTALVDVKHSLHAVIDPVTTLWHFKYDHGTLPQPMKGQWTSFTKLYDWAKGYFDRRNIDIVEVID